MLTGTSHEGARRVPGQRQIDAIRNAAQRIATKVDRGWLNRARHTAIARAMRFEKTYYSPLVAAAFGAGAVDVVLDEAVVLNGYPGGPFT